MAGEDAGTGRSGRAGERGLTRREVLGLLGGGVVVASGCVPGLPGGSPGGPSAQPPAGFGTLTPVVLRRREDFLRVEVSWRNAGLRWHDGRWVLTRTGSFLGGRSDVVFDFGPQVVVERAFHTANQVDPPPIGSRLSGSSRLAFRLDRDVPFDLESLLDWAGLAPSLVPAAVSRTYLGQAPVRRAPGSFETAIEVPWHLILSPTPEGRWVHDRAVRAPVDGRHELWHTSLTAADGDPAVRAVHHLEPGVEIGADGGIGPGKPWSVMALGPANRADIVENSTMSPPSVAELLAGGRARLKAAPPAIDVERLMLTALGAWYELDGSWPDGPSPLQRWRQRGTMGRDHYSELVYKGWLFPYGHRAVAITITERAFDRAPGGRRGAYLRQRTFVVVTQRVRRYAGGDADEYAGQGRDLPFVAIECLTKRSADFVPRQVGGVPLTKAKLPITGDAPTELSFVGVDWAGGRHPFDAPVVFLSEDISPEELQKVVDAYQDAPDVDPQLAQVARRPMPGGEVVMTQPWDDDPGSSSFALSTATFGYKLADQVASKLGGLEVPFVPVLAEATGKLPQAASLGAAAESTFTYFKDYVDLGFDVPTELAGVNPGQVFAELKGAAVEMAGEAATGIMNGVLEASGLSRTAGVVAGELSQLAKGNFTPESLLDAFSARLFGVVSVKDLIKHAVEPPPLPSTGELLPKSDDLTIKSSRTGKVVETHLEWKPTLKPSVVKELQVVTPENVDGPVGDAFGNELSKLALDVRSTAVIDDPSRSTFTVDAEITNVRLDLVASVTSFLVIDLRRVSFSGGTGRKTDVDVDVKDVQFHEALEFVAELASYVSGGGLGPTVDVAADGVTVAYAAPLPSIQIGVFALQNLSFSVGAFLPFKDDPLRISAAFSSRDNPFMLTIGMFGGGGWASLVLGADEVEELDIGLEFGANASLDIGVASGGVSLTAGIYLATVQDPPNGTTVSLTGFLRMCGELEVLGIISVSAEFFMALTYLPEKGKAHGRATLTVEVEVLFVSKSVELTVERWFSSSPNDPTFRDLMPPEDDDGISDAWLEYCQAFGAEEAA